MFKSIIICIVGIILLNSCNGHSRSTHQQNYLQRKADYRSLVQFLAKYKRELSASPCIKDKNIPLIIDMNLVDQGCFKDLEDSLVHYKNMKLYETIEYIGSSNWAFQLNRVTDGKVYTESYMIYSLQEDEPKAYKHCKYKERIDVNWWYIECSDAIN